MTKLAHLGRLLAGLFLTIALAAPASATIRYEFEFFDMAVYTGTPLADFDLTLETPDYITAVGMNPLPDGWVSTPLGYSVGFVGTNPLGQFMFGNYGAWLGENGSAAYTSASFRFTPTTPTDGYIRAPGVYAGRVDGNAGGVFYGDARLTVTDTAVPEPATWAMMILGLGAAGAMLRRRRVAVVAG